MQSKRKFSQACEQNKDPILEILKVAFKDCKKILEIGSGSGQHAIYFANHLPHLSWQPSDLLENLDSIRAWIDEHPSKNICSPIELDVTDEDWEVTQIDGIFSANCFHIMSWEKVEDFFRGVGQTLRPKGKLLVYGPFSYQGEHTSPSNARFDQYLKLQDPLSGVRDFMDLNKLAEDQALALVEDFAMPANNRCLLWQKV